MQSYCSASTNANALQKAQCTEPANIIAYIIVFVGLILMGIGSTLPYTLGMPLIDDNVKQKSLPKYFGAMQFVRRY